MKEAAAEPAGGAAAADAVTKGPRCRGERQLRRAPNPLLTLGFKGFDSSVILT